MSEEPWREGRKEEIAGGLKMPLNPHLPLSLGEARWGS